MTEGHVPPERLLDLGGGLAIWRVHIDDLEEQSLNARSMKGDMFARLTETIGRDGRLESLPFAAMYPRPAVTDDASDGRAGPRFEIVSGHHRTRAARAAGVWYAHVIADETGLTRDQVRAKQLAHNAISGEDEAQLIARIYGEIMDVDARLEAFIPDQPADATPPAIRLPNMDLDLGYRVITLVFLPHQADAFDHAIAQVADDGALGDEPSQLGLIDIALLDQWKAAASRFRREYDARAVSVQMSRLIDAACEQLGIDGREPADIDPGAWVPLTEIVKSAVIPPESAEVISQAVKVLIRSGQVEQRTAWKALEILAQGYLRPEG